MNLDTGAVDEQPVRGIFASSKSAEDVFPDPAFSPTHKAVVQGLFGAINMFRAVAPTPAALQRVDDAGQNTTVINTARAAQTGGKKRRNPLPLCIRKPKQIRHLQSS